MKRRNFLQNTCPTITFAFFGLSFIQACSKSDDDTSSYSSNNSNVIPGNSSGTNTGGGGTTVEGGVKVPSVEDIMSNPAFEIFVGIIAAYALFKAGEFAYKKFKNSGGD